MKAFMIYGITLYENSYDEKQSYIEVGTEYFLDRMERDERLKVVAMAKKEPFEFRLSKSTAWKLNNHVIGREKKQIVALKDEISRLKRKLDAKIELIFND